MKIVNMPEREYHALPNLSASRLKKLKVSPAEFKRSLTAKGQDTEAMRIGSAIHMLIMEPDRAAAEIMPIDTHAIKQDISDWNKLERASAKKDKRDPDLRPLKKLDEIYEHYFNTNPNNLIIPLKEYKLAKMIANKALAQDDVKALFSSGIAELTILGNLHGNDVKIRMDWLRGSKKKAMCVDIKTIAATPKSLANHILDYGYHIQQAFYEYVAEQAHIKIDDFVFLFIFKEEPFDVVVVRLSDEFISYGREESHRLITLYESCVASGEWPGKYPEGEIMTIELPGWVKR